MKKVCRYNKNGDCHLGEMEDCQPCGIPELDKKVHHCPFHPAYDYLCFDDAMVDVPNQTQASKKEVVE